MHHANEHRDEPLIDLGAIVDETKGSGNAGQDFLARQPSAGLADE